MKKSLLIFLLVFWQITAISCEFEDVKFDANFSAARLDGCEQLATDRYRLTIKPENLPINPSPWYAFKVTSKKDKNIRIEMDFVKGKPRYLPKISHDGQLWKSIPHKIKSKRLTYQLKVNSKPLWVAGQEIIDNSHYVSWTKGVEKLANKQQLAVKRSVIGISTEKRHIYQLQSLTDSIEWVIILGRMHPPEITGALALFPFTEELLFNQKIGERFRQRFNLLIVPNLNPDGVEHGNWRHNANGIDLNRDWKKFNQKETQLIRNKLEEIVANGGKIVFAVDFHSTDKDIFYTMPSDYGLHPPMLVEDWLGQLDKADEDFKVIIKPGNNPDKGVLKQYIADNYGVHAITYEVGDNSSRKKINQVARLAATTLMQQLLQTPAEQFGIEKAQNK